MLLEGYDKERRSSAYRAISFGPIRIAAHRMESNPSLSLLEPAEKSVRISQPVGTNIRGRPCGTLRNYEDRRYATAGMFATLMPRVGWGQSGPRSVDTERNWPNRNAERRFCGTE